MPPRHAFAFTQINQKFKTNQANVFRAKNKVTPGSIGNLVLIEFIEFKRAFSIFERQGTLANFGHNCDDK